MIGNFSNKSILYFYVDIFLHAWLILPQRKYLHVCSFSQLKPRSYFLLIFSKHFSVCIKLHRFDELNLKRMNIIIRVLWGTKEIFRVCAYCGWEILRLVSDSLFLLPHSLVIFFLFVEAVKELKTEK